MASRPEVHYYKQAGVPEHDEKPYSAKPKLN